MCGCNVTKKGSPRCRRLVDDFLALLDEVSCIASLGRRTRHIVLVYHGSFDATTTHSALKSIFEGRTVGITVGSTQAYTIAYVFKADAKALHHSFDIADTSDLKVSPVLFRVKRNVAMHNFVGILKACEKCAAIIRTDISVHQNTATSISFDSLNSALSNLTPLQVETIRGRALAERPDRRS